MTYVFLLFLLLSPLGLTQRAADFSETFVPDPADLTVETWVSGLVAPWSLVFLSDTEAIVSERGGTIRLIENGVLREEPYIVVSSTLERGEGGLMGLALHPDFPAEPFVYLVHTYEGNDGAENRILRLRHEGDSAVFDRVILRNIPGARFHNGGRIAFGPDGMLYVTTGENFIGDLAQDLDSLAGKILRLMPDGRVPDDNPFPGSYVYSYGHRNAQGLAWHPETGSLFSSEHGPSGERGWRGHDELNVIEAGANYGWPLVRGAPGEEGLRDPLIYWEAAAPPAGMTFHNGDLYIATLRSQALLRIGLEPSADGYRVDSIERLFAEGVFEGRYGRLRDAVSGPDGALYVLTSNRDGRGQPREGDDRILRITTP